MCEFIIIICVSMFPCSRGSIVTNYEVRLTDTSSDPQVQTVLVNYVDTHNGKLGDFSVIMPSS